MSAISYQRARTTVTWGTVVVLVAKIEVCTRRMDGRSPKFGRVTTLNTTSRGESCSQDLIKLKQCRHGLGSVTSY